MDKKEKKKEKRDESAQIDKEPEELKEKIHDFEDKYKRALADYQNLEKRVGDQRIELIRGANRDLLLRLLPVLDTLMLASVHTEDQGVKVTVQQFIDTLKNEGVERIETKGVQFDPTTMEAIATGDGKDGEVLEELRTGFMINGKLLRPVQVKVGKS